jgi:hypothetical protein
MILAVHPVQELFGRVSVSRIRTAKPRLRVFLDAIIGGGLETDGSEQGETDPEARREWTISPVG